MVQLSKSVLSLLINFSVLHHASQITAVGNYPEPVAEETEVRYNLISMLWVPNRIEFFLRTNSIGILVVPVSL